MLLCTENPVWVLPDSVLHCSEVTGCKKNHQLNAQNTTKKTMMMRYDGKFYKTIKIIKQEVNTHLKPTLF